MASVQAEHFICVKKFVDGSEKKSTTRDIPDIESLKKELLGDRNFMGYNLYHHIVGKGDIFMHGVFVADDGKVYSLATMRSRSPEMFEYMRKNNLLFAYKGRDGKFYFNDVVVVNDGGLTLRKMSGQQDVKLLKSDSENAERFLAGFDSLISNENPKSYLVVAGIDFSELITNVDELPEIKGYKTH